MKRTTLFVLALSILILATGTAFGASPLEIDGPVAPRYAVRSVDALPRVTALYRRFANEHRERRNAAGIGSDASPLQAFVTELES